MRVFKRDALKTVNKNGDAVDTARSNCAKQVLEATNSANLLNVGFRPIVWLHENRVIGVMRDEAYIVNVNANPLEPEYSALLGKHQRLTGQELYVNAHDVEFLMNADFFEEGYRVIITDDFDGRKKPIIDVLVSKRG